MGVQRKLYGDIEEGVCVGAEGTFKDFSGCTIAEILPDGAIMVEVPELDQMKAARGQWQLIKADPPEAPEEAEEEAEAEEQAPPGLSKKELAEAVRELTTDIDFGTMKLHELLASVAAK